MPAWDDVAEIGPGFPGVETSTSYGTPALKVKGKLICRLRTDPDALVVRVLDVADAEALVQGGPEVFFTTPHYDGYPYVLVRLEVVDRGQLASCSRMRGGSALPSASWRNTRVGAVKLIHQPRESGAQDGDT